MKTFATPILLSLSILLTACGGESSSSGQNEVADQTKGSHSIDNQAPSISLKGSASITLEYGGAFVDPGATAIDDVDGDVQVVASAPNLDKIGSHNIIYTAKDRAGNSSSATRLVQVVDTVAPVVTLVGALEIVIKKGELFEDPGAFALDNYEGEVKVNVGDYDVNKTGLQEITYTAIDSSGNVSSVVRELIVESNSELFSLNVSWGAPDTREDGTSLNTREIAGYKVYMGVDDHNMELVAEVFDAQAFSTDITQISEGIYFISVTAFDINGLESALSDALRIIL
jgi:hypothetical protein